MSFRLAPGLLAFALLALVPGAASAQSSTPEVREVRGSVYENDTGDVFIGVNRGNVFRVTNDPWLRHLRNALGETVEARIKITNPGPFGGDAEVEGLVREVEGTVSLPVGGQRPMISVNRSNLLTVKDAAWSQYLIRKHLDSKVRVRVRVTKVAMFGGEVDVLGLDLQVKGFITTPVGGAPMIQANKSNIFQVTNEPFAGVLRRLEGRYIAGTLRLTQPGMFGGRGELRSLQSKAKGPAAIVRARAAVTSPIVARVAEGTPITIVGATTRFYEVQLADGTRGFVVKGGLDTSVESLADTDGLIGSIPGQ
jgi:hypothetical protein